MDLPSQLIQEMNALALRYGVDNCAKALKEIQWSPPRLQRGVNVARDIPRVLELSWEHMVNVVGNLFSETSDDDEHYCCSCTDLWNKVRELLP